MRYISTRGQAPPVSFLDAVLNGMAPDGGLYVPEEWPVLGADALNACINGGFAETAGEMLKLFAGDDLSDDDAYNLADAAYSNAFAHQGVAPLTQLSGGAWLMELFHGPSLAFKDIAMQLIVRLYDHVMARRGGKLSIACATSGDTGGAAVEAFKGSAHIDLFVLLPRGRVSEVQQRFMTTCGASNVHCVLIDGDFDAAQAMLKAILADRAFAAQARLSAVNSINWARILAQSAYFVIASTVLAKSRHAAAVSFAVPTGNFGDAYAAFVAAKIGAPIGDILAAVNANDILWRGYIGDGYVRQKTVATASPAMDIQAPSNFERYVFERLGRDGARTGALFEQFSAEGVLRFTDGGGAEPLIAAQAVGERETMEAMRLHHARYGALVCPHTAVALAASELFDGALAAPLVHLATAHPAKFPDTVERATGVRPQLPAKCADLFEREEKFDTLPAEVEAVKQYIRERSRAWS